MHTAKRQMTLKKTPNENGSCVIYVMSRDQRVRDNHALLAAQAEAIEHELPLAVVFNLYHSLGNRRREQYEFMVEGLKEVEKDLKKKNIPFILLNGDMPTNVAKLAKQEKPRTIYFDFSPLRHSRSTQKELASKVECRVIVVDTHNIVPTWVTSDKEEFAAHTIRRKLHNLIAEWATDPETIKKHPHTFKKQPHGVSWSDIEKVVKKVPSNGTKIEFTPGETAAKRALSKFIETGLDQYASGRNDATSDNQSDLSPYLHYGQISSLRILLGVMDSSSHTPQLFTSFKMPDGGDSPTKTDGIDAFVEELIVRKELSDNFCLHNPHYDSLAGARDWAKKTLEDHKSDPRESTYSFKQLEAAETHDDLWNAAQTQMTTTGKIHGYMRMYWAKKILEWTNDPAEAVKRAMKLNDMYHIDGGDPNGYVGVLWSIGGVHDRPWFNREIYGTVRYMAKSGAEKKFDTKKYIEKWLKK